MPALDIPESGLSLEGFSRSSKKAVGSAVPDVFGLTLTDGVIEEMIKCVQNGQHLQLSLGDHPSLTYGNKVQHLATSHDPFSHDLFRTTIPSTDTSSDMAPLRETKIRPSTKPNHAWMASMGMKFVPTKNVPAKDTVKPVAAAAKTIPKSPSVTAGADAALLQLQGALASDKLKKQENTTKIIKDDRLSASKRGPNSKLTNKNKFLSQNRLGSDTTRSMPSSPALSGVGSPSLGPTSVPLSQQQAEKDKTARKPVIHLLAAQPLTESALQKKLPHVSTTDLNNAMRKVGDLNDTTGKWELRKLYYKELDVWTFQYDPIDDRQRAIDNAVKQYDKMRLGVSEPEWDKLLHKSERGTGKSLSKLQASIVANGIARQAPQIKVSGAEDSGLDSPAGEEDLFDDKNLSKVKGEGMARSASQPPTTKNKKVSEKEAQAKRLFAKNPGKAAAKAVAKTPAAKKEKEKAAPAPKAGTKVLSSEYVEDSDDDDPAPPPVKEKPKQMPKPRPAAKRPREEDTNDTSDSSIPLSKKVKKDPVVNHRVSDASQTSRTTITSQSSYVSSKNKSNSPQKSSPLASSPPTNASDFENSFGDRASSSASPAQQSSMDLTPAYKRHQKSASVTSSASGASIQFKPGVLDLARRYKSYYPKYIKLFQEVQAEGDHRTKHKERDLLDMHARLETMRRQIEEGVIEAGSD